MGNQTAPDIPHPFKNLPDSTRWMVFKVKQRAAYNYFAKTANARDDKDFKFEFPSHLGDGTLTSIPNYSYNWPFDFFSLIELAKIDATVEMKPEEPIVVTKPPDQMQDDRFSTPVYDDNLPSVIRAPPGSGAPRAEDLGEPPGPRNIPVSPRSGGAPGDRAGTAGSNVAADVTSDVSTGGTGTGTGIGGKPPRNIPGGNKGATLPPATFDKSMTDTDTGGKY